MAQNHERVGGGKGSSENDERECWGVPARPKRKKEGGKANKKGKGHRKVGLGGPRKIGESRVLFHTLGEPGNVMKRAQHPGRGFEIRGLSRGGGQGKEVVKSAEQP